MREYPENDSQIQEENPEINRRDYLNDYVKPAGKAALTGSLAGCFHRPTAPRLEERVEEVETSIRRNFPIGDYNFNFEWNTTELDLYHIEETNVQDASNFGLYAEVDLADDSDDLFGWLEGASRERQEQFFEILSEPMYDLKNEIYSELRDATDPQRPLHRNRITEYGVRINGRKCSYIEDFVQGEDMDETLRSASHYRDYIGTGEEVHVELDRGWPFGLGWVC